MINQQKAREIVREHLDKIMEEADSFEFEDDSIVILDDETIELPYGWIFFYQSKKCIETGDFRHMLGGNSPILVEKIDGTIHHLGGVTQSLDEQIHDFEIRRFGKSDY